MVPLDSQEWHRLRHAYGAAEDIPGLLRQLSRSAQPKDQTDPEPWSSLWSSLCHQGDAYDASYAAVPHIVEIGTLANGPIDFIFFMLPACIEIARQTGRGPTLPAELVAPYGRALHGLHECAFRHANNDWDEAMAQSVATALAAAKGQTKLAEALRNLDEHFINKLVNLDL